MKTIPVYAQACINHFLKQGFADLDDLYSKYGFKISGFINLDFSKQEISACEDGTMPEDCVVEVTLKNEGMRFPIGREQYDYYVNPKGYHDIMRPLLSSYIDEHHPVTRSKEVPITIEMIDELFDQFWKDIIGNSRKKAQKMTDQVNTLNDFLLKAEK